MCKSLSINCVSVFLYLCWVFLVLCHKLYLCICVFVLGTINSLDPGLFKNKHYEVFVSGMVITTDQPTG